MSQKIIGRCSLAEKDCILVDANVVVSGSGFSGYSAYVLDGIAYDELGSPLAGSDAINDAIAYAGDHSKIAIFGDSTLSLAISIVSMTDVTIELHGVITFCNNYNGRDTSGSYRTGIDITSSDLINIVGGVIDGNKSNQVAENGSILINNSHNIKISSMELKNAAYKAIVFAGDYSGSVENVKFTNNCYTIIHSSDIFADGTGNVAFENCDFVRSETTLPSDYGQSFYMNAEGVFLYKNNRFINICIPYDFRKGTHEIIGSRGENVMVALATRVGTPTVFASGMIFSEITGQHLGMNCGIFIGGGSATVQNSTITAKENVDAFNGIYIRYAGTENCEMRNNHIIGFSLTGIRIYESDGNHLITKNKIEGGTVGIESLDNTSLSNARNNLFSNVVSEYNNEDENLIIE